MAELPTRKKITLDDIAREAGVSRAAASKALNGRHDVSEATRRSVRSACDKLGYSHPGLRPRGAAESIAIVADNLSTTYTIEILKGASTVAMQNNISISISHLSVTDEDAPRILPLSDEWIRRTATEGAIGVITITSPSEPGVVDALGRARLAYIAIDPASPPPEGTTSIGATNWNGGLAATEHLIGLGHRRIAFIRGGANSVPAQERFEGYVSALRQHRIDLDPAMVLGEGFTYENGRDSARTLLSRPESLRPTAIVSSNDVIAIGVYEAARELGLSIPFDLSVVGFDDTDLARWSAPRLTTIHQPLHEMGVQAVRTILAMTREADQSRFNPIQLTTHLVERHSTAAPATP